MDEERLRYLFGTEALELLDDYDLDDESGRVDAVDRFLALPADAPDRNLLMAVRSIVVAQILIDEPPATWSTVQRLRDSGLDRDTVLSQLSVVVADHVSAAVQGEMFDTDAYVGELAALPFPSSTEIVRRLIDVARAQPGINAGDHEEAVLAELTPFQQELIDELVVEVVEGLIGGVLHWLPDDSTVYVPDLVDGHTFLHRLTDAEADLGVLSAGFDLGAFARFETVRLGDGTVVEQFSVESDHLGWRGEDGWLAACEPGCLLAVSATVVAPDDGSLDLVDAVVTIDVCDDEPDATDVAVNAVRAGYEALLDEPGLPVGGEDLALWLLFHHPEMFAAPQPPLAELCVAAGLEKRGGRVAHDETVWHHEVSYNRFNQVLDMVPEREWRLVLGRAIETLDDPDASVDDVRASLAACAEPETLEVLTDVFFDHGLELADEFERDGAGAPGRLWDLVNRATAVARRPREIATAEYLACVLYERCGAAEVAEQHVKRAVDAQPRLGPVVERMGWYRFDRGDARGAMRWWQALTELPAAAATLRPFLAGPGGGRKVGRNDPCWCGSGRKFKHCHQDSTDLPALPDRVGWLCRKASLWVEHAVGDTRVVVTEMATARATGEVVPDLLDLGLLDNDDLSEMFAEALGDPIVFDAALHEGGLFRLFLRERGELLPEDEQLLAASWLTISRSVHEILDVDRGVGVTVRDLATGEVASVRERTASIDMRVGERYCGRVVPDGESHQFIGGLFEVRTGQEESVLELCAAGDGVELCAWVGVLRRPPRLVHRPGMIDDLLDREAIEALLADGDIDDEEAMTLLGDEISRQARDRWLDESIPALGGLTPREAAADPTRREQVERLLDEFATVSERFRTDSTSTPASGGFQPVTYDVDELRQVLGLSGPLIDE